MDEKALSWLTMSGTTLIGLLFLGWWLFYNPVGDIAGRVPGHDNRPEDFTGQGASVEIGTLFAEFDGVPSDRPGTWPRFRGAAFDNIVRDNIRLADTWGAAGPEILWSVDLGEGHAGAVVSNGRVYVLDYDEEAQADILRCFSLDDGKEIWRRGYGVKIKRNHGISRTVPAVSDRYVVTIGPKGHVMGVDALTGELKWGIDLQREFEAEVPLWYTGQCVLIDGSVAVIAVGGTALLIGVDCETGEIIWETPNPQNWSMSHSSVMPFTIHGVRMYVYSAIGGIVGVSAEEETAGQILFESSLWNHHVIAPSPVHLGDGRIFLTAGYGGGSMMLRLNNRDGVFVPEVLQSVKPGEGIASEQQTPIFYNEHLISILPKDAGPLRNQLVCSRPGDLTQFVWSSGKTNRFGLGPYIIINDKLYVLSDDGVLTVLEASTEGYHQLAQAKILDGVDAWAPLAYVDGMLLARDSRRMVCVDLRARPI